MLPYGRNLHLGDQGLPEEVITSIDEGFAALARELEQRAEKEGGKGLPGELLERIGLNPAAIEALQKEKDPTGLEMAALAQTIIGNFAPAARHQRTSLMETVPSVENCASKPGVSSVNAS